jgi:hypothetical protein
MNKPMHTKEPLVTHRSEAEELMSLIKSDFDAMMAAGSAPAALTAQQKQDRKKKNKAARKARKQSRK